MSDERRRADQQRQAFDRAVNDLRKAAGVKTAGMLTRYAKGPGALGALTALVNLFTSGRRGQEAKRAAQSLGQTVQSARRLLEQVGYTVTPGGTVKPVPQSRSAPPVQPPPIQRPVPTPQPQAPIPGTVRPIGSRFTTQPAPPRPGEESPYGEEILTPQSSNVYSFSYARRPGDTVGTLFVRYKASGLNPDSVSSGKGRRGGREQLHGKLGSTVKGKKNEPGPLYAYLRVPPSVYSRMQAASSKGRFVWDTLRIRGTVYGHKYAYQLVQGQVITDGKISGVYIPRKATKKGFQVRSVADVGTGRRSFQSSTLPSQRGFSTRRR